MRVSVKFKNYLITRVRKEKSRVYFARKITSINHPRGAWFSIRYLLRCYYFDLFQLVMKAYVLHWRTRNPAPLSLREIAFPLCIKRLTSINVYQIVFHSQRKTSGVIFQINISITMLFYNSIANTHCVHLRDEHVNWVVSRPIGHTMRQVVKWVAHYHK